MEKDDKESFLGFNKRNCVIYRMGEKFILTYLREAATRVHMLAEMDREEAEQQITEWNIPSCEPYFSDVILPLLESLKF